MAASSQSTTRPPILRDVERRLGVSSKVAKALVELGYLPSSVEMNPICKLPSRVVLATDLVAFQGSYVSLTRLAAERGVHFLGLKAQLGLLGVAPAFDRDLVHATFYLRAAITEAETATLSAH